ncbi:hypothetical protein [Corallococcus silvisoli]|uniref:hypothetical protein n=1 Tax=Corallococcus silvisoli TaxID=2697031 RepID=UPI0013789D6D|nr:hypothetical protein [Corallococcus silvisoli]NBD08984.1 hypothetical protein [Corallococcus silvisoli]
MFASIAALFVSACGGAPSDESSTARELGTQEQGIIYTCDGSMSWTRYWYSDIGKTVEVGREICNCDGSSESSGVRGRYYDYNGSASSC